MPEGLIGIDYPSWLSFENPESMDRKRLVEAVRAACDWHSKYNCNRKVKILPFETEHRVRGGYKEEVLERANGGWIMLGREGDPYQIVLHAMTHAVKPDQPTLLPEPFPFTLGVVRGWHGAIILVTLDGEEDIKHFRDVEEGIAERNAAAFKRYTTSDYYYPYRELAQRHFPYDTQRRAHEYVKTNNGPAIIRTILGLPKDSPVLGEHVDRVIEEYTKAWETAHQKSSSEG